MGKSQSPESHLIEESVYHDKGGLPSDLQANRPRTATLKITPVEQ
jgi:hypothetical protein